MRVWLRFAAASMVGAMVTSGAIAALLAWLVSSGAWAVNLSVLTVVPPMLAVTGSLHLLALGAADRIARIVPIPLGSGLISAGLMLAYIVWMLLAWGEDGSRLSASLLRIREEMALLTGFAGVGGIAAGAVVSVTSRRGGNGQPGQK